MDQNRNALTVLKLIIKGKSIKSSKEM